MASGQGFRGAALVAIGAVAAFLYANFLLSWMLRGDGMGAVVSLLEAPGQPYAGLLRVTDVVCAVLVLLLLPPLRDALPRGPLRGVVIWATVVFALGATVAAIAPPPCGPDGPCATAGGLQSQVHDGSSIVSEGALFVGVAAAWFLTRSTPPLWFPRLAFWCFWLGGVVCTGVFYVLYLTGEPSWGAGAAQRVNIVSVSVWILGLALLAAQGPGDPQSSVRSAEAQPA